MILYDPPRHRFDLIPTGTLANSNIVFDVAEDAHHNLWIQTSNQLLHFETNTGTLSKSNLSNSFKGQHPGYFMHEGKELYATFEGSLFKIPLDQLIAKDEKLKLYLREIKTREEPLEWENKLRVRLPYSDNFLSYGFVAIDYENPQGVRYWYRIPEINNDWISIDKNTSVNFGRLSPGTYHFSVKAANSAGWVSEEVHAPPIHITPPFWRSWWFIALVILISTTLMGYLLWLKRMKTEAEMRLRNKIAKDLHDDIGSTLSGIRIFSGIAADMATGHEELSPILRKISDKSDTMMQSMSDIVWSVNPVYDSLHDMMIRLKQYMSEVLESQNIDVHVQSHVDLKNIKLGLQQRKEIYLALKEIIHNAAKHAQCQVLNFDISRQKNELVFRIQDDGIGIDESNLVYGNGLRNIQERIHGIGGQVLRQSSPGQGMNYEIRVRIS